MKYFAAAIIIILIASCTKTKTVTITTPPVHDTTTVTIHDTAFYAAYLVGSWTNNNTGDLKPIFTTDTLKWSGSATANRYVASGDTIFFVYPNEIIYPEYNYQLSQNADTLTITSLHSPIFTNVYFKL